MILVPFASRSSRPASAPCEELERRGYDVRRVGGYAAIDQGRNQMATDALLDGYEETMWIDADVDFHPDAVDRLRVAQPADRLRHLSAEGQAGHRQPHHARHAARWSSAKTAG